MVEGAIQWTLDYTRDRQAFGKSILSFQNTQFKLAELQSHAAMLRTFIDRCLELHIEGGVERGRRSDGKNECHRSAVPDPG